MTLHDGARTTVYVASHDTARTDLRLVRLPEPTPLEAWCHATGATEALVGGFFARPHGIPLGELRTHGVTRPSVPFDDPWAALRACVHVHGGRVTIARRPEIDRDPRGDLLQAGPLLVAGGRRAIEHGEDLEGFSAGSHQFDSDITDGRHPRAALGIAGDRLLAVACDGRGDEDAGLTMAELADLLVGLGAEAAINLDGGGSTSLVCTGRLRNRPRASHGVDLPGGRPVSTALVFALRA